MAYVFYNKRNTYFSCGLFISQDLSMIKIIKTVLSKGESLRFYYTVLF